MIGHKIWRYAIHYGTTCSPYVIGRGAGYGGCLYLSSPQPPFFPRVKHGRSLILHYVRHLRRRIIRHRGVWRSMEENSFTIPPRSFFVRFKHGRSLLLHYVRLRRRAGYGGCLYQSPHTAVLFPRVTRGRNIHCHPYATNLHIE